MKRIDEQLNGLQLFKPAVFEDDRGHFFEGYSKDEFAAFGISEEMVQMNQSFSKAGVLRGLHFQAPPYAQSKLVHCLRGKLFDVAVDIRTGSSTYGQWYGTELSEENKRLLYVPRGYAHGFLALTDCEMLYLCGWSGYNHQSESGLRYNDPDVNIAWPSRGAPVMNERDATLPLLHELKSPFTT